MQKLFLYLFLLFIFCGCKAQRYNSIYCSHKQPLAHYPNLLKVEGGNYINNKDSSSIPGFFISQYEITNEQFAYFLNHIKDSCWFNVESSHYFKDQYSSGEIYFNNDLHQYEIKKGYENYPVRNVCYWDAYYYGIWLTRHLTLEMRKKKLTHEYGIPFRLPQEVEWYYAASERGILYAKQKHLYSGSDKAEEVAWYNSNSATTHAVGQKKPNVLGLYDMSGNVYEWTPDPYSVFTYDNWLDLDIPDSCAIRGGSYLSDTSGLNVLHKNSCWLDSAKVDLGFRVGQISLSPGKASRKEIKFRYQFIRYGEEWSWRKIFKVKQ